jgi:hypothetical protein
MSIEHRHEHPVLRLMSTLLRVWAVGFVLAAKGSLWLIRKTLLLLPFRRAPRADASLIE